MATEKRRIWRVTDVDGNVVQVLPETSAEQVTIADAGDKFTSGNVEGALQELAQGIAGAGKVDDVVNADGSSIVDENKKAQLKDAVVKEAGKVTQKLRMVGTLEGGGLTSVPYDGSKDTSVTMSGDDFTMGGDSANGSQSVSYSLKKTGVTAGTYQGITVDEKGRVTAAEDKAYATKQELQEAVAGKTETMVYDNYQAFVTATDALAKAAMGVNWNVLIRALGVPDMWVTRVNDVSTQYVYTNDQAIVDALNSQYGLTVGYFTFSQLETTKVDLSEYQKKTDDGLLTDDKTVVGGINEVRSKASDALSKSIANETAISNIEDGTTVVPKATNAAEASKVANKILITTPDESDKNAITHNAYDGSEKKVLAFDKDDFYGAPVSDNTYDDSEYTGVNMALRPTGVAAGQYSAVNVESKGRVTAGGKSIEWGTSGQTEPSDDLMVGGFFMEFISQS